MSVDETHPDPQVTVTEFNQRVTSSLKAGLIPFACWALIFEQRALYPRRVRVPPNETWDLDCGSSANTEDFNLDNWFCEDRIITSISCFPGTDCRLRNGYDIVTLQPTPERYGGPDVVNDYIRRKFSIDIIGDLMVFKRSQLDHTRVVSVTSPEIPLVCAMVQRWLEMWDAGGEDI